MKFMAFDSFERKQTEDPEWQERVYWPPRFVLVTSRSLCFAKRDERTVHSHLPPYNFIIQKSLIESIHDKWTRKIENWSHKTILLLHLVSLYYIVLSCRSFCLLSNHLYLLCLRTTKNCIVCTGYNPICSLLSEQ